jgi:hypothetical protein
LPGTPQLISRRKAEEKQHQGRGANIARFASSNSSDLTWRTIPDHKEHLHHSFTKKILSVLFFTLHVKNPPIKAKLANRQDQFLERLQQLATGGVLHKSDTR